jgi:hypothetical protein
MPIPIILVTLLALFTLGTTMKNKPAGKPEKIVIIPMQGQHETAFFANIFQCSSLYQIINEEPMTSIHSNNSNITQAIVLSEKE